MIRLIGLLISCSGECGGVLPTAAEREKRMARRSTMRYESLSYISSVRCLASIRDAQFALHMT